MNKAHKKILDRVYLSNQIILRAASVAFFIDIINPNIYTDMYYERGTIV